jgi:hypothetical protein
MQDQVENPLTLTQHFDGFWSQKLSSSDHKSQFPMWAHRGFDTIVPWKPDWMPLYLQELQVHQYHSVTNNQQSRLEIVSLNPIITLRFKMRRMMGEVGEEKLCFWSMECCCYGFTDFARIGTRIWNEKAIVDNNSALRSSFTTQRVITKTAFNREV